MESPRISLVLVLTGIGALIVPELQHLLAQADVHSQKQNRTLTFAQRVNYQRAIERVYWRHRIWPKENPGPKPSLDEVMSVSQIEKKVEDYMRKSQALEENCQRPITREQLQTEMDRIAGQTRQPDVLRELFAALGNDPFVIAECLTRPILAARLIAQFNGLASESSRAKSTDPAKQIQGNAAKSLAFAQADVSAAYNLPEISVPLDCADDTWTATTTTNAPDDRQAHTAVWTGSEMIVWGGGNNSGSGRLNTGARYDPSTDSWTATSITNAPAARLLHAAIWTGNEMIVWGGWDGSTNFDTGGRYNPSANSWTATSTANAPAGRYYHTAVWTGSEMIVWGGTNGFELNTGGRYNPSTDSWLATNTVNTPANRYYHTTVWTGSEMIVWGGWDGSSYLNTGGRYSPSTDSWIPMSIINVPAAREIHTAVWTSSQMIIWGGLGNGGHLNTGGKYDPSADSWTATSTTIAPESRRYHTAVWTGNEMIVWGGVGQANVVNTGGRYNPIADSWTPTSTTNTPVARAIHTAVWTGSEMIVWGGVASNNFDTGGKYCAQFAPSVVGTVSRKTHGAAGSFDVDLPLSGTSGVECRTNSATNDHAIVVTFSGNVTVNGNPQAAVTSGIGTIGSEGMSNGGMVFISANMVTVPLTNVANAQTINVTLFSVSGDGNVVIPMSVLVGDVNGNGTVNASDVSLTKSRIGQPVNQTNFRSDVSAGGSINATDVSLVKLTIGSGLP